MADKSEILLSKTLGDVEELLSEYPFFRIHHSRLINFPGAQVNIIDLKDEQSNAKGTKVELKIPF